MSTDCEVQLMGRRKGGKNMKTANRRIEIIPEWRDQPDIRMLALALIQIAQLRLNETEQKETKVVEEEVRNG